MSGAPLLKNEGAGPSGGLGAGTCVVGCLKEKGDSRVSLVPDVAKSLIKQGWKVAVESGAGDQASFTDTQYRDAGCTVAGRSAVISQSDILLSINVPESDFSYMKGKVVISWASRMFESSKDMLEKARRNGVTLLDTTAAPRITIAQKLDVLSSQAKCAGHRAIVEAQFAFGRFHSGEMTAAGKYPPSQTFVLGCGVAGLAAIGAAKAIGSVVRAWDVRDVSDQVVSMGGKWVSVDFEEDATGTGGYAKESSAAFQKAQLETFHKHLKECDIVITTAAIPGRKSPRLVEPYMVQSMKPGSVIVDLAAAGGGNCASTKQGEKFVTPNGVTIIGYTDLPGRMAWQSSAMYAQNMQNLINHIAANKPGEFLELLAKHVKDPEGEIVTRSVVCCMGGEAYKMPPPPPPPAPKPKEAPPAPKPKPDPFRGAVVSGITAAIVLALLLGLGDCVPSNLLTTFLLAGAAGYQVVWGVQHALHTPLMSVTNAISGSTAIGGLLLIERSQNKFADGLAAVSVAVSAINIFGGFIISQRMLNLFKRKGDADHSWLVILPGIVLIATAVVFKSMVAQVDALAALLCIGAIGGLATMKSANAGCKVGMLGVGAGVVATLVEMSEANATYGCGLLLVGAVIGMKIGTAVSPIALPQTVAGFHSLVGFAAMCTSIASFIASPEPGYTMENVAAILGDFIGGVTLTGSIVAFGKLNGNFSSKALDLPGKNYINLLGLFLFIFFIHSFLSDADIPVIGGAEGALWATAVLSMLMGWHLVGSVGGGDMPVCITVLNSYSGWALVAEGFLLRSPMLTIVGSLIGFSGGILTKIMCDAMNRDIFNVIFGGMNVVAPKKTGEKVVNVHTETSVPNAAELLVDAKKVLIVPGYGMAVARAQTACGQLSSVLRDHGCIAEFGIHPVAGRMPGQMNVLLAEASVPYDWVKEMDEVNPDMESYDIVLVVGANDITNKAAKDVEGCPIYGMPVIEVWRAKKTIFFKRSMGGGYADLENPVFFMENTDMLLGDGKKSVDSLFAKVEELYKARGDP